MTVKRGQRWRWMGLEVYITRVARDGAWADTRVVAAGGATWSKRQPLRDGWLPYPATLA